MMETNQMTKKILDFQKGAFASWYGVVTAMQDQAASSINAVLDQSDWMPDEGRRMVLSWVNACKKGREDVKELVEESFSGLERVLVKPVKKASAVKKAVSKSKPAPQTKSATPAKPKSASKSSVQAKPKPAATEVSESAPTETIKSSAAVNAKISLRDKEKTTK